MKKAIINIILGSVCGLIIFYGFRFSTNVGYQFFYKEMVERTVIGTVKTECLKEE